MDFILHKENYPGWRFYGKRYLSLDEFTMLCTAVGLYHSHESELEDYERERIMFPAARMIMPDDYAKAIWLYFQAGAERVEVGTSDEPFHKLDWALRYQGTSEVTSDRDLYHPIDIAWGQIEGLVSPAEQEYVPWNHYQIVFEYEGRERNQKTATHFYHHWQIYEFYLARNLIQQMYVAPAPIILGDMPGHIKRMSPYFDAMSYFQHLYRGKLASLLTVKEPDEDNLWRVEERQQEELEESAKNFAQETIEKYGLSEGDLYVGLEGLANLHYCLSLFERIRLADTLKLDIWRMVELTYYATDTQTEKIAQVVGGIAGLHGDYIELLFPNQRKRTKEKAVRIMNNLADEHNTRAPNFLMREAEIDRLFDYLDKTELVLLGYILQHSNEAHYARHSWKVTEEFINLKSLASFPESMMRVILLNSGDNVTINRFNTSNNPGMGKLSEIYFQRSLPNIWNQYDFTGHRMSRNVVEFTNNLGHLIPLVVEAPDEDLYIGASLSLATCIRNFTSHLVVESPNLLQNQYVRCVRAITSSIFLIWHESIKRAWVT